MQTLDAKSVARKQTGTHYTPAWLADVLATKIVGRTARWQRLPLRVLDPACGDGILLASLLSRLQLATWPVSEAVGIDTDANALIQGQKRLAEMELSANLIGGDFLEMANQGRGQLSLWEQLPQQEVLSRPFDAIIANPPYVRTQVLGADRSRALAERFGLSGRVDLYHAFLVAMTQVLKPGGLLGVITSNRFLVTDGAAAIREYLRTNYDICEVIDLGDTKVFAAAVLPAILIAIRREPGVQRSSTGTVAQFVKVYKENQPTWTPETKDSSRLSDVLANGTVGVYQLPEGVMRVTAGQFRLPGDPRKVWALASSDEERLVTQVRAGSCGTFGDVAHVRVGIKTTADEVFVRTDWNILPAEMCPEAELLRPVLQHESARRWCRSEVRPSPYVLYPHKTVGGHRCAVDLARYPRTQAYFEANRMRLERRKYVRDAGRRWYEIWVPQDPDAWAAPKIVFPDISPEPRFYLDSEGTLVDGDCYWMSLRPGKPEDLLYLFMAIANSKLMTMFHDIAFNNRLYSGRRRYITQYVSQYPFPPPESPAAQAVVQSARALTILVSRNAAKDMIAAAEAELETLVASAFGVASEERT